MVTGDQAATARSVGAAIGLAGALDAPPVKGRDIGDPAALSGEEREKILSAALKTRGPGANGWLLILGMSLIPLIAGQVYKAARVLFGNRASY